MATDTTGAAKKVESRTRERRTLWILIGCFSALLVLVVAGVLLLIFIPEHDTEPPSMAHRSVAPPPVLHPIPDAGRVGAIGRPRPQQWARAVRRRQFEHACVNLTVPSSAAMTLMSLVLPANRQMSTANLDMFRSAFVTLLPSVARGHVMLRGFPTHTRCCIAGNGVAHADDLIDAMSEPTFVTALGRQPGLLGVQFLAEPELTLVTLTVPPSSSPSPAIPLPPSPLPPSHSSITPSTAPSTAPSNIFITIYGENPDNDERTDVVVWADMTTSIQFAGSRQLNQFDFIYFSRIADGVCNTPPIHEDLSGFLDADLRTTIKLAAGIYHMCTRQGTQITYHPHIRVIANTAPALTFPLSPPPPPEPPPPPATDRQLSETAATRKQRSRLDVSEDHVAPPAGSNGIGNADIGEDHISPFKRGWWKPKNGPLVMWDQRL